MNVKLSCDSSLGETKDELVGCSNDLDAEGNDVAVGYYETFAGEVCSPLSEVQLLEFSSCSEVDK